MAAHDFIGSIFGRTGPWNAGLGANVRAITPRQLAKLRELIGQDEEGSALVSDGPGKTVWMPSGRDKYVIVEDPGGRKHTIERKSNLVPCGMGRLF